MSTNAHGQRFAPKDAGAPGRARPFALVLALLGSSACGGSDGGVIQTPLPGSISLATETSGFLKDDSYELFVSGESKGTIGANDEMTIEGLDPATYEVTLGDVAENCTVDAASVEVASDQTASVSLSVVCEHPPADSYTLRFGRARPNLDDGVITECPFSICSTEEEWDLYVHNNTQTTPNSVIRQNQTTGVEIAHIAGVVLADLTEADVAGASFSTSLDATPFDADRVILIRTDLGAVYALGNPVEDDVAQTLTFDAALVANQ